MWLAYGWGEDSYEFQEAGEGAIATGSVSRLVLALEFVDDESGARHFHLRNDFDVYNAIDPPMVGLLMLEIKGLVRMTPNERRGMLYTRVNP